MIAVQRSVFNMCGIIGVYSSSMYASTTNFFTQGLYMDALRGKDSTGAALIKNIGNTRLKPQVDIYKKAMEASEYLKLHAYKKFITDAKGDTPRILLGHNRSATKGDIINANAHPFREDHIIMVHNGSLWDWSDLPDGKAYDVDSKAICHSIAVQGIDETIRLLDGSFTIVYIDLKEMTLNMIRNNDRPLTIFTNNKKNEVYWSSEQLMGESLLTRNNIQDYSAWLVEPYHLISFDLTKDKDFRDFSVREVEAFILPSYGGKWNWYGDDEYDINGNYKDDNVTKLNPLLPPPEYEIEDTTLASSRVTRLNKQQERLRGEGIDPTKPISIITHEYKPYDSGLYGVVKGCMIEEPFIDVVIHGILSDSYEGSNMYYAKPICFIDYDDDVGELQHIICNNLVIDEINKWDPAPYDKEDKEDKDITLESFDPVVMGPNGIFITEKEFEIRTKDGCAMCGDYIEVKDSLHISWTSNNEPFCPDCWDEWSNETNITGKKH